MAQLQFKRISGPQEKVSLSMERWSWIDKLASLNQEIWLVVSILVFAVVLNYLVSAQRMVLGFYILPTLFAAYVYGRRHAVLAALASCLVVGLLMHVNPHPAARSMIRLPIDDRWFDLAVWTGVLLVTAYAMGTLYELRESHIQELRDTYYGILVILQSLVSDDQQGQQHAQRVAAYAMAIAKAAGMDADCIDDVRTAALLHEVGSVEAVRPLLLRAAEFAAAETSRRSPKSGFLGIQAVHPIGGTLQRVLPIIAAFHSADSEQSSSSPDQRTEIEILKIADVYDSLTSDRPYRKGVSPFDARTVIIKGEGLDFESRAVNSFRRAFDHRQLELVDYTDREQSCVN